MVNPNKFFADLGGYNDVVPMITPVDLQTGANTGQRVDISGYGKATLFVFKGIGTAGDDPVITPTQSTAYTGGSSKGLNFTSVKERISASANSAVTAWTETVQASGPTFTDLVSAESLGMIAIEIDLSTMDLAGGYKYLGLNIPDVGSNAQLGCAFVVLTEKRYAGVATVVNA